MKKVKTSAKMFTSNSEELEDIVLRTIDRISNIVGATLGPGGRNIIIESELPGIANKNSKDGVSVFRGLGSHNSYEHIIIEQVRDAAVRTVNEVGDGTTTSTVVSAALIKNTFEFCKNNRKMSPQKITRHIAKLLNDDMLPFIKKSAIHVNLKNHSLLEKVATVSSNGDKDMAKAVMEAFEKTGFSSSSHVTIQELSGPNSYGVNLIEGFPINKGYEESVGRWHPKFINDQGGQRCVLEKPLFVLFDGRILDMVQLMPILNQIGQMYVGDSDNGIDGDIDYKNIVIVAHGFGEGVLNNLAMNFSNPNSINVVPLVTPLSPVPNPEINFLMDLSAFTGAKIYNMNNPLLMANEGDLGRGMEKIEIYRFRTTVVGDPDPLNIEYRTKELKDQAKTSESKLEKILLEERIGKLTSGIAELKIFGSSNGELKERADRAEDAVCAVRAAISYGCLPGGGRVLINIALDLLNKYPDDSIVQEILYPSLTEPFMRILHNAGYNNDEIIELLDKMIENPKSVYDVENQVFGDPKELGLFDAAPAVEQALKNAISIASVMGTLGGIIAFPRDNDMEIQHARDNEAFKRSIENAGLHVNEANKRS